MQSRFLTRIAPLVLSLAFAFPAAGQVTPADPAFLRQYGIQNFSQHYIDAFRSFVRAEERYQAGDFLGAGQVLDTLWNLYPVGGPEWGALPRQPFGINLGTPPLYYSLRMLTDMTSWRRGDITRTLRGRDRRAVDEANRNAPRSVQFTVVLVGETEGIEPRTLQELNQGGGIPVLHSLDARVPEDDHRVVHESLNLFREYVLAMTEGRVRLEIRILSLPGVRLPVHAQVSPEGRFFAGLVNYSQVWQEIPEEQKEETDWWWLLYPSHVPEQYPDFASAEFVTGGMGVGPDGTSPCFIIDDRWLVRKPPHLGSGPYSDVERRAYLPQWLQHEFFHHLFRTYPSQGLEDSPHQWFDRATWPADFQGIYEADYFHEALHRRLRFAEPPLHVNLRYATDDAPWESLRLDDVLGRYRREPIQNPWHIGNIHRGEGGEIRWTNTASVSWVLQPDLASGVLHTGPDCPYYDPPNGTRFSIVLRRDDRGDLTPEVEGFAFSHEIYRRR